jgi:hypothetical protein
VLFTTTTYPLYHPHKKVALCLHLPFSPLLSSTFLRQATPSKPTQSILHKATMPKAKSRSKKKPNKARPRRRLPATTDPAPGSSALPTNPLAVSLTEDEGSLDGRGDLEERRDEKEDREYDELGEDTSEADDTAQPMVNWGNVWYNAVWRITAPTPNSPITSTNGSERRMSISSTPQRHIHAAGLNFRAGPQPPSSSSNPRTRATTGDTPLDASSTSAEQGTPEGDAEELAEDASSSSSEDSDPPNVQEAEDWQLVHDFEANDYWTFVEAPEVEDDWDMVPEADRIRERAMRPTFNSLVRQRFEAESAERAEREARELRARERMDNDEQ